MGFSYGMIQQQEQRMIMTPELRQAIKVLQLPTVDLARYVENAMVENPVLEEAGSSGAEQDTERANGADSDDAGARAEASPIEGSGGEEPDRAPSDSTEVDWERYFADGTDIGYPREGREPDVDQSPAGLARWEPSLLDHLCVELSIVADSHETQVIGEYLLGCLDDSGFFLCDVADAAAALGVSEERVESVLGLIQTLEPAGVGARSLEECLDIQILARAVSEPLRTVARNIVARHLDDVAAGRLLRISSELGVDVGQVQEAVDLIRSLDPRPGAAYGGSGQVRYVVPDVFVEEVEGELIVVPNDSALPRLLISRAYRGMLSSKEVDQATKDFIKGKLDSALWLIRSIEQRRNTILRVTESIVRHQREFFRHGMLHMKPLTLREVACDVDLHESTVSRATSGKYVETVRGTFELRFFFGSGVSTSDGSSASSTSIKRFIRMMIAAEDAAAPLSDLDIMDRLKKQGIDIARRTVAKYREEMSIPSSTKRRRY